MDKELGHKEARYTEEQIAFALKQAEAGTPVAEVIRRAGVSEQTFYRWMKDWGHARNGLAAIALIATVTGGSKDSPTQEENGDVVSPSSPARMLVTRILPWAHVAGESLTH